MSLCIIVGYFLTVHGLNVSPPQIHMLKPNPYGDVTESWGLWEVIRLCGQSPYQWDQALTKELKRALSPM